MLKAHLSFVPLTGRIFDSSAWHRPADGIALFYRSHSPSNSIAIGAAPIRSQGYLVAYFRFSASLTLSQMRVCKWFGSLLVTCPSLNYD